jgi:hypothetical protein
MNNQDIADIDFALVDIFKSAIETNTLYQSYLPADHYESFLCKAACIESQAFIDSYETNLLSTEGSLSNREGAAEAMDIFEKTFQMIDSDVYRKKEFRALCSSSEHLSIDHAAFNRFQKILKIYIASLYRESQTQLDLFLLIQEHSKNIANEDISDQELSLAIESLEKFESKLVEVSACSVTTAIVLCEETLKLSNSFDENFQLDILRPASNFDEFFNSLEYFLVYLLFLYLISSEVIKAGVNIPKSVFFVHEDSAFMYMTNKILGQYLTPYTIKKHMVDLIKPLKHKMK